MLYTSTEYICGQNMHAEMYIYMRDTYTTWNISSTIRKTVQIILALVSVQFFSWTSCLKFCQRKGEVAHKFTGHVLENHAICLTSLYTGYRKLHSVKEWTVPDCFAVLKYLIAITERPVIKSQYRYFIIFLFFF